MWRPVGIRSPTWYTRYLVPGFLNVLRCSHQQCSTLTSSRKVLKEIPLGDLRPNETVQASQEAQLLSRLHHPHILRFFHSFLEHDTFCIITEYCQVPLAPWFRTSCFISSLSCLLLHYTNWGGEMVWWGSGCLTPSRKVLGLNLNFQSLPVRDAPQTLTCSLKMQCVRFVCRTQKIAVIAVCHLILLTIYCIWWCFGKPVSKPSLISVSEFHP